eukprot:487286-Pleurochrysis_carterae.AAC.1
MEACSAVTAMSHVARKRNSRFKLFHGLTIPDHSRPGHPPGYHPFALSTSASRCAVAARRTRPGRASCDLYYASSPKKRMN